MAGEVHDRDVVRALVRHVGGASISAGGDPVGRVADDHRAADGVVRGVQDGQLTRALADDQADVSVGCQQRIVGRSADRDLADHPMAHRLEHLHGVHAS